MPASYSSMYKAISYKSECPRPSMVRKLPIYKPHWAYLGSHRKESTEKSRSAQYDRTWKMPLFMSGKGSQMMSSDVTSDQWDLEYKQLFAEGVCTIDFDSSFETLDLTLPLGSYRMIFENFENNPYFLQCNKYTSHPENSKLITLLLDRMNVCLPFGTKYVKVLDKCLRKNLPLFSCTLSLLSEHV